MPGEAAFPLSIQVYPTIRQSVDIGIVRLRAKPGLKATSLNQSWISLQPKESWEYSKMTVNVLTMTHANNSNNECHCLRGVDYSVIADSDTIVVFFTSDLLKSQHF